MNSLLKTLVLLAILGAALFVVCDEGSIPDVELRDAEGNDVKLLDTDGKEYGVLMYLSRAPCGSHPKVAGRIDDHYFQELSESTRYYPIFVYGDADESAAMSFAEKFEMPTLLDGGKEFAEQVKINNYYALIIFEPDGNIAYRHDGSFPYPPKGRTYAELCDHMLESSCKHKLGCPSW